MQLGSLLGLGIDPDRKDRRQGNRRELCQSPVLRGGLCGQRSMGTRCGTSALAQGGASSRSWEQNDTHEEPEEGGRSDDWPHRASKFWMAIPQSPMLEATPDRVNRAGSRFSSRRSLRLRDAIKIARM